MFENLHDDNISLYAAKHYDSPFCLSSEFDEDVKRFVYLKRLFKKYRDTGELRERLILNHIIVIYNVFGNDPATRMLFFKIPESSHSTLKTYLIFLYKMPPVVYGIRGKNIISSDIPLDHTVVNALRTLS